MAKLALRSNRKFRRLLAMVRVDSPEHLRGHLSALWEATWENGTPLIGDFNDIEAAAGWTMADQERYPPGAFAAAMVMARLVDVVVEGHLYAVHDWYEHAPEYVKKRIGRAVKEDPTVGPETYFLGLDVWVRRAAEAGVEIDFSTGNDDEDDLDRDTPNRQEVSLRQPKARSYSKTAAETSQFLGNGSLSSLAESRRDKPSHSLISPPSSPPSLFPADPAAAAALRAAQVRVTVAVDELATADGEAADLFASASTSCRSLGDWHALADMADEALRKLNRNPAEVPA